MQKKVLTLDDVDTSKKREVHLGIACWIKG